MDESEAKHCSKPDNQRLIDETKVEIANARCFLRGLTDAEEITREYIHKFTTDLELRLIELQDQR